MSRSIQAPRRGVSTLQHGVRVDRFNRPLNQLVPDHARLQCDVEVETVSGLPHVAILRGPPLLQPGARAHRNTGLTVSMVCQLNHSRDSVNSP